MEWRSIKNKLSGGIFVKNDAIRYNVLGYILKLTLLH